jgi:transcriptional regulator with XRE-family HTH domain
LIIGQSFGEFATKKNLTKVKKVALRYRVWFSSLSRVERGIIDLTVRYVDNVKSARLAKVLRAIVDKLQSAMESTLDRLVKAIGLPLARKISNIALSWGNSSAHSWAEDRAFARFLVVNFGKV